MYFKSLTKVEPKYLQKQMEFLSSCKKLRDYQMLQNFYENAVVVRKIFGGYGNKIALEYIL